MGWQRKAFLGASVAVVAVYAAAGLALPRGRGLAAFGDVVQCLLAIAFVLAMAINVPGARGRAKSFWMLLTLGALLLTISQFQWTYYEVYLRQDMPNPYWGDILAFVHYVPLIAALALVPHARPEEKSLSAGTLDFLILMLWWIYLYIFLVIPWQYIALDVGRYSKSFQALYILEAAAYIPLLGILALMAKGRWRWIYGSLCAAYALNSASANVANYFINNGNRYYTGSLYDVPLIASVVWLIGIGFDVWLDPPKVTAEAPRPHRQVMWLSILAMLCVLSIPVLALWGHFETGVMNSVRDFRLIASLVAITVLAFLVFLKQHSLDRELLALLQESKDSLANLQRLQGQLIHSEKMASLGQLVAGAAHEINNPLTAILGYVDLLGAQPELSERDRDLVGKIDQHAKRTKTLVSHLLSFAKQIPAERRLLALNSVLRNAVKLREVELANRRVQVSFDLSEPLPQVEGDSNQLLQVFFHIINNAADAMHETDGPELLISTRANGDSVFIEFADNGPGIQDPQRIFDPFYTTKPVGKGTGLGLSAAYGIIHEHHGAIECENRPGGGAIFRISLPLRQEVKAEAALV